MTNPNGDGAGRPPQDPTNAEETYVGGQAPPKTVDRKPLDHKREDTRNWIALSLSIGYLVLTGILLVVVVIGAVASGLKSLLDKDQLQAISTFLLSPLNTLVSVVIGFYFGSKASEGAAPPKEPSA